jgi:hypothetical protein
VRVAEGQSQHRNNATPRNTFARLARPGHGKAGVSDEEHLQDQR